RRRTRRSRRPRSARGWPRRRARSSIGRRFAAPARGESSSVTAAATRGVLGGLALFHLEGVAAAARGGDVRVVDGEARLEALDPIDLGAGQVGRAERIDDDRHALARKLVVALLRAAVEAERVLEPGAAAALDGDAQDLG